MWFKNVKKFKSDMTGTGSESGRRFLRLVSSALTGPDSSVGRIPRIGFPANGSARSVVMVPSSGGRVAMSFDDTSRSVSDSLWQVCFQLKTKTSEIQDKGNTKKEGE